MIGATNPYIQDYITQQPKRFLPMRCTTFLLFVGLLYACNTPESEEQPAAAQPPKPNIIFIMADDLGYGDLGSYGQEKIQTPGLDRMAAEGLRFTQVYAGAPVCAPSRSVLMTGQHTGHTKVRGNFSAIEVPELPNPRRIPLAPEDTTIADILKRNGYVTGMFGKWGLGEANTSGAPNAKGFDEWFGFNNQRRAHRHYPDFVWHNQDTFHIEANQGGAEGQHVHELFTQFAMDFLEQNQDTAFFLYLPYTLPHDEFAATDEYLARYENEDWTEQEKTYAAMVSMVDADVAQLLDKLLEYEIAENTLVFFCSDNGAANRYDGTFDSSGSLRGRKRDMYEGGIRTPMIAWMPGTVPSAAVSDEPWYFPDVVPTLAEFANAKVPENIDGISILPALMGEAMPESERYFYWEFHERDFDQAVRWQDWKGVRAGMDAPLELYDLSQDVGEDNDVSADYPEVTQQLNNYLDTVRSPSIYWPVEDGQSASR